MKKLENQKGITLVALVVTIIVLLILAGVSLSLVAGSDGILGRASDAVDKHQIGKIKENIELLVAEDVEAFYEAKHVKQKIGKTRTALSYMTDSNFVVQTEADKTDSNKDIYLEKKEGNTTYQINIKPASGNGSLPTENGSSADELQFTVRYMVGVEGNYKTDMQGKLTDAVTDTDRLLTGKISSSGSITWYDLTLDDGGISLGS